MRDDCIALYAVAQADESQRGADTSLNAQKSTTRPAPTDCPTKPSEATPTRKPRAITTDPALGPSPPGRRSPRRDQGFPCHHRPAGTAPPALSPNVAAGVRMSLCAVERNPLRPFTLQNVVQRELRTRQSPSQLRRHETSTEDGPLA